MEAKGTTPAALPPFAESATSPSAALRRSPRVQPHLALPALPAPRPKPAFDDPDPRERDTNNPS